MLSLICASAAVVAKAASFADKQALREMREMSDEVAFLHKKHAKEQREQATLQAMAKHCPFPQHARAPGKANCSWYMVPNFGYIGNQLFGYAALRGLSVST